jgi:hypothetical protein
VWRTHTRWEPGPKLKEASAYCNGPVSGWLYSCFQESPQ